MSRADGEVKRKQGSGHMGESDKERGQERGGGKCRRSLVAGSKKEWDKFADGIRSK